MSTNVARRGFERRDLLSAIGAVILLMAPAQMPNPKDMSGIPRPDTTVPVGTVSVRVIRGSFDKNIANQSVQFTIDGRARMANTDAEGRAQVADIRTGATVVATTVVDGERWVGLIDTNLPTTQLASFPFGHIYEVTGRSLVTFALSKQRDGRLRTGLGSIQDVTEDPLNGIE